MGIREWLERRGFSWRWSHREDSSDPIRFRFRKEEKNYQKSFEASIEFSKSRGLAFVLEFHPTYDESTISGHVKLPIFGSAYFSFEYFPFGRYLEKFLKPCSFGLTDSRQFGFCLYEEFFWIYIYTPVGTWSSTDPWWQRISIDWKTLFMGKQIFHKECSEPVETKIFFPEKLRTAMVKYEKRTWTRTRWPGAYVSRSFDFNFQNDPIPIPGKGENSWDCDDDAIYSTSICVDGPDGYSEAVKKLQDDVDRTRTQRGGASWSFASMLLKRGTKDV